jgi:hypothetical protein
MSFRELTMVDVKETLRRWQVKQSDRRIARETGADRKTVKRYTEAAKTVGLQATQALGDEVIAAVGGLVQVRAALPPGKA